MVKGNRSGARTLWRLDESRAGRFASLYIVSPEVPSIDVLVSQLGTDPESGFATSAYEPFLDRLEVRQEWGFRLKANPTKSVPSGEKAVRGKRIPIVKREEQIAWLEKRAAQCGFHLPINRLEVSEVVVSQSEMVDFARQDSTVTFATAVFDGVIAVDDPQKLRQALLEGIGRAKGYGYGLLTLIPLPRTTVDKG
jgi:CRISPR system Cascade subunit CasE